MEHPKCKCGTEYVWDWEMDSYRTPTGTFSDDGDPTLATLAEFCAAYPLTTDAADADWFKSTDKCECTLILCGVCNEVLGGWVHDPNYGAIVLKRADWPAWQNVDWEQHAWEQHN